MTEVPIEWSDICRHEHRCKGDKWFYHTVPAYSTYTQAMKWLQARGCKLISAEGEKRYHTENEYQYTGRFTFKFLCEQEYMMFVLRWS